MQKLYARYAAIRTARARSACRGGFVFVELRSPSIRYCSLSLPRPPPAHDGEAISTVNA